MDDPLLLVFVREPPGRGGEEEVGQDEDAGRHRHHELAIDAGRLGEAEGDQDDEGVLEQIVVEGTQELGDEQRQEAPALEDAESSDSWGQA